MYYSTGWPKITSIGNMQMTTVIRLPIQRLYYPVICQLPFVSLIALLPKIKQCSSKLTAFTAFKHGVEITFITQHLRNEQAIQLSHFYLHCYIKIVNTSFIA